MPFIVSRVNFELSPAQEKELKQCLGGAIALVPGKSEQSLLLDFEDRCHLYLAGSGEQRLVYVEAGVFANETHAGYEALTAEITAAFVRVCGVDPAHVYVRYADIPVWAVGGMTFDRRRFA